MSNKQTLIGPPILNPYLIDNRWRLISVGPRDGVPNYCGHFRTARIHPFRKLTLASSYHTNTFHHLPPQVQGNLANLKAVFAEFSGGLQMLGAARKKGKRKKETRSRAKKHVDSPQLPVTTATYRTKARGVQLYSSLDTDFQVPPRCRTMPCFAGSTSARPHSEMQWP